MSLIDLVILSNQWFGDVLGSKLGGEILVLDDCVHVRTVIMYNH